MYRVMIDMTWKEVQGDQRGIRRFFQMPPLPPAVLVSPILDNDNVHTGRDSRSGAGVLRIAVDFMYCRSFLLGPFICTSHDCRK
jgi:hypothetical protein